MHRPAMGKDLKDLKDLKDQPFRDKLAMQDKIRKEFDKLSAVTLLVQRVGPAPTPALPRVPPPKKFDRLRPMVLATRLLGISPVLVGPPAECGRPTYRQSRSLVAYSMLVNLCILVANGMHDIHYLLDSNPVSLVSVLLCITHLTSFVSNLFYIAGTVRKYRLLHTVLSWPTATTTDTVSSTLVVAQMFLAVSFFLFDFLLGSPPLFSWYILPFYIAIISWQASNMLERFMLAHLVKRVGHSFATVNAELRQLAALMRERPQKYLPTASAKAAALRAAHDKALDLLQLVTEAYEFQVIGFMMSDFARSVTVTYLTFRQLGGAVTGMEDRTTTLLINNALGILGTIAVCLAGNWTSEQGNETHSHVHRVLRCVFVNAEETNELTIFSLQLMHQNYALKPLGIMDMDNTLLSKICLTVVMYVVVLIQFGSPTSSPPQPTAG